MRLVLPKSLCLLPVILLLFSSSNGQAPNYKFVTYTAKQGLCSNSVTDCVLDKKSFLWIATENGLSRFDGVSFLNFFHDDKDSNSLPFNFIQRVYCDYKNRVWVTGNSGIAYYNQSTGRFTSISFQKRDSRVFRVNAIAMDNEHRKIWYADNGRLNLLDLETFKTEPTSLAVENSENLNIYMAKNSSLWLYDVNQGYTYQYNILTKKGKKLNTSRRGRALAEDQHGNVWMGCYLEGITQCNDTSVTKFFFVDENNNTAGHYIRDMQLVPSFTGDSLIWVATSESGIRFFDPLKKRFEQFSLEHSVFNASGLPDNRVNRIYCANDGIVWICTASGISKLNKDEQQFISHTCPFLQVKTPVVITAVLSNKKNTDCWMVTYGAGLIRYNPETDKVMQWKFFDPKKSIDEQDHVFNRQVSVDASGNRWIASNYGLLKIDPEGTVSDIPLNLNNKPVQLSCIYAEADSVIWCGSVYCGLIKYDRRTNHVSNFFRIENDGDSLKNATYKLLKDADGNFWMASKDGLLQFDRKNQQLNRFSNTSTTAANNSSNVIYSEAIDNKGMIWLATIGGVVIFNPVNKAFANVSGKNIPAGLCTCVRKDRNGFMWVLSASGLCKINPADTSCTLFTEQDGVVSGVEDQLSTIMDFPGDKWAIGYRGSYTLFDPLANNLNNKKVNTCITEVTVFNEVQQVNIDSFINVPMVLSYKQNQVGFKFSGIEYSSSERIEYAYMLEGYNHDWVFAGNKREVSYTNLFPGDYTFKVKARNSSGLWNEAYTSFHFNISTPFWKTWWFISLLCLAVATVIWLYFKAKEQRSIAEQQLRDKIARDLHDDVGSTLSGINLFSKMALQKIDSDRQNSKSLVEKVVERSDNMVSAMNDIVWSVNPVNDSLEKIIIRMRSYALDMLEEQNIKFHFNVPGNIGKAKMSLTIRKDFYLIYKEAINNIAKYSRASEVTVSLEIHKSRLMMTIADNGVGFDVSQQSSGNGLNNMKARAIDIKAALQIQSEKMKGTVVSLAMQL